MTAGGLVNGKLCNVAAKWLNYCLQFTKPLVHLMLHFPVLCAQDFHTQGNLIIRIMVLNAELRGKEDIWKFQHESNVTKFENLNL